MSIYYSPSRAGFFHADVHGDAMPEDVVEISGEAHAQLLEEQAAGKLIVAGPDGLPVAVDRPPLSFEQQASALRQAVQRHLDATAQKHGYDSILAAVSYADCNSVPIYQEEGREFRHWRSMVWAAVNDRLSQQPLPTAEELITGLPASGVLL